MISSIGSRPLTIGTEPPVPSAPATGDAANRAATPAPSGSTGSGTANATVVTAHEDGSAKLQLTTREGDTVTLSADFSMDATLASASASGNGRGASARYASLEISRSVSMQVQGDLSPQEMADVQKLVKQFVHEMRDFFKDGKLDGDPAALGRGTTSIASASAQFDLHASLSVTSASASTVTAADAPRGQAAPLPVSAPIGEGPAAADPSSSPARPSGDTDGDGDSHDTPANAGGALAARLADAAKDSNLPLGRMLRVVSHVFAAAERATHSAGERSVLTAAHRQLRDILTSRMPAVPATPATTASSESSDA